MCVCVCVRRPWCCGVAGANGVQQQQQYHRSGIGGISVTSNMLYVVHARIHSGSLKGRLTCQRAPSVLFLPSQTHARSVQGQDIYRHTHTRAHPQRGMFQMTALINSRLARDTAETVVRCKNVCNIRLMNCVMMLWRVCCTENACSHH